MSFRNLDIDADAAHLILLYVLQRTPSDIEVESERGVVLDLLCEDMADGNV